MTDNYIKIKEHWESNQSQVHGDMSESSMQDFAKHIIHELRLGKSDTVLDIGCGDGKVDRFIVPKVKNLFGFDLSTKNINLAKELNPNVTYWTQSFMDKYQTEITFDKAFSLGVLQYCYTSDLKTVLHNSIDVVRKGGLLAHLDIADRSKMHKLYLLNDFFSYPSSKLRQYIKHKLFRDKQLFKDGSKWIDMKYIAKILKENNVRFEITDSWAYYKSHLIIYP